MAHIGRGYRYHLRRDLSERKSHLGWQCMPNRMKIEVFQPFVAPLTGTAYGNYVSDVATWTLSEAKLIYTFATPGWDPDYVLTVVYEIGVEATSFDLIGRVELHDAGTLIYHAFGHPNPIFAWPQLQSSSWVKDPTPLPFPHDVNFRFRPLPYAEE